MLAVFDVRGQYRMDIFTKETYIIDTILVSWQSKMP